MRCLRYSGFSLLEIVLAIGILAIILPIAGSLFYAQQATNRQYKESWQQIDIINDFQTYTQIQNFDHIKQLSKRDAPIYIIEQEEDDIIFREFVDRDIWEHTNESNKEYFSIKISKINDVFTSDDEHICPYLPLMCKLSKIYTNGTKNVHETPFISVKVY